MILVTSVRSRPFEDVGVSFRGGIAAGALVDLPANVLRPAKDIKMTCALNVPDACLLVPRAATCPRPTKVIEMSLRCCVATRPSVPRAAVLAGPSEYMYVFHKRSLTADARISRTTVCPRPNQGVEISLFASVAAGATDPYTPLSSVPNPIYC